MRHSSARFGRHADAGVLRLGDDLPRSRQLGHDRRRISRSVAGPGPGLFAVGHVQRNQGPGIVSADVDNQPAVVNQRRHGRPVERRRVLELLGEFLPPLQLAGLGIPSRQDAADAEGEQPAVGDDRRALGPFAMSGGRRTDFVGSRIALAPNFLAVGLPQCADDFLVVLPREDEDLLAGDDGRRMAHPDLGRPFLLQLGRPDFARSDVKHYPVAVGTRHCVQFSAAMPRAADQARPTTNTT